MIDEKKVEAFVNKAVGDLGAALTASLVVIGELDSDSSAPSA